VIGLIAKEYGYTLDYIASLTDLQVSFLLGWLEWYWEKQRPRKKVRKF